ncbi:immunity protein Imm33 domain-containing protein [Hymenobacter coalescens]
MPETAYQSFVAAQQEICKIQGQPYAAVDFNSIVGISNNLGKEQPTHGLRHAEAGNISCWYLWSGELSEADDFFRPVHLRHLLAIKPEVITYLALPPGFRFIIDDEGFEDVWFDAALLLS